MWEDMGPGHEHTGGAGCHLGPSLPSLAAQTERRRAQRLLSAQYRHANPTKAANTCAPLLMPTDKPCACNEQARKHLQFTPRTSRGFQKHPTLIGGTSKSGLLSLHQMGLGMADFHLVLATIFPGLLFPT